jgi:hypothetical protein
LTIGPILDDYSLSFLEPTNWPQRSNQMYHNGAERLR